MDHVIEISLHNVRQEERREREELRGGEEGSKMAAGSHASASSPQIMCDDVAGANPVLRPRACGQHDTLTHTHKVTYLLHQLYTCDVNKPLKSTYNLILNVWGKCGALLFQPYSES